MVLDLYLRALNYYERLATLLQSGAGLWDVMAEAEREGSLNWAIANASRNALAELVDTLANLLAIGCNGGTEARVGARWLGVISAAVIVMSGGVVVFMREAQN